MIPLTKLNGQAIIVHAVHIESVEACPDTRLSLINGKQVYVQESPDAVSAAVTTWYRQNAGAAPTWHAACECEEVPVSVAKPTPSPSVTAGDLD